MQDRFQYYVASMFPRGATSRYKILPIYSFTMTPFFEVIELIFLDYNIFISDK